MTKIELISLKWQKFQNLLHRLFNRTLDGVELGNGLVENHMSSVARVQRRYSENC